MKTSLSYGRQYIDAVDIREVARVLRSDFLTQGPAIPVFEKRLAKYCGADYCVVVNSGTAALHCAYHALGLRKGDEFITSPNTFAATSNAGLYCGAKPVFIDIEPDTGNIDASLIEQAVTKRTKLLAPVHYSGHPVDMAKIYGIAKKHGLRVVEDACHALGARYKLGSKWYRVGSCAHSDMAVLSFHPVKHITTGEGGAILTNDKALYGKMLVFRTHGITKKGLSVDTEGDWYYEMQDLGYNYRLTDIQAALGTSQLKKMGMFLKKRREIADRYRKAFNGNPYFDAAIEREYAFSSYHLFPIRLKDEYKHNRKEIFKKLRERGIGVQVHYIPVCRQPYYRKLGYKPQSCPRAEDFYQREISIPMYPSLSRNDVGKVIRTIAGVFSEIRMK